MTELSAISESVPRRRWARTLWWAQTPVPVWLVVQGGLFFSARGVLSETRGSATMLGLVWLAVVLAGATWPRARQWLSAHRYQLLAAAVSTLLALAVVGESAIRLLSWRDIDGNRKFRTIVLKPLHLPWRSAQAEIDRYLGSDESTTVYDPDLGWGPRPSKTADAYAYNAAGIRVGDVADEFTPEPAEGVLRIVLLGDSFTQGAESPFDDTWGHQLEQLLEQSGRAVEVLNFGVGGYGMDQAYLRWQTQARLWRPHVVVFGLQPENVHRNVNLIRRLYQINSGNPLSKPRFVLEDGALRLLNRPCLAPEQLAMTIRDIAQWDLVRYEEFYNPADYEPHFWQRSLLLQVARAVTHPPALEDLGLSRPRVALSLAIIKQFARDVTADGARFVVVNLPAQPEMQIYRAQGRLGYEDLAAEVAKTCPLVRTEGALAAAASESSLPALFMPQGHYSSAANAVVARELAQFLARL